MEDVMKNAMFTATSAADFWGRKWNLLIHGVLKVRYLYTCIICERCAVVSVCGYDEFDTLFQV